MILLQVNEEDFSFDEPIIHALVRQHYPIIDGTLSSYRNGMEYSTLSGDIYELRIRDFVALKRREPKLYYLEHKGCAKLTLARFWMQLDYCSRNYAAKHFLDDSFWDYWQKWLDKGEH